MVSSKDIRQLIEKGKELNVKRQMRIESNKQTIVKIKEFLFELENKDIYTESYIKHKDKIQELIPRINKIIEDDPDIPWEKKIKEYNSALSSLQELVITIYDETAKDLENVKF